jgi:hypothetical protein
MVGYGVGVAAAAATCNGDPAAIVGGLGPQGTLASMARERNGPVPSQLIQDLLVLPLGPVDSPLEGRQLRGVFLPGGRQLMALLLP